MILSQGQLSIVFEHLMEKLIDNLDEIHLDTTFKYLMNGLKHRKQHVYKLFFALLTAKPMKWRIQKCLLLQLQLQLYRKQLSNDVSNYLMNGLKYDSTWKGLNNKLDDKKEDILKCKEKQFDNIIDCWIDELKGEDEDACRTCAESIVNLLKV
ncbi:hypothetical protein RFI_04882 [Reticulomyxa filosa]|uniref:Uncharacterized protein n=1 Tax=Reticulomyxa filosa TaxID=46433 RepID=X6P270_RETFI|nr:hypothetical protein RFI_04882 [Reticulomyxa filosa]|eukprot:ETO32233.1 hypothetical protein RFI_04882 [Reticulomyxa filosa]